MSIMSSVAPKKTNSSFSESFKTTDLSIVADLVPAIIGLYNIRTGAYIYVNHALRRILGYEPEDFTSRGMEFVSSLVHPLDLPRIMTENQAVLDTANKSKPETRDGEPIASFEYRMRHAKGHWVWLQTDGSVFDRDENGKIEHVLNVSLDITAKKDAERRMRRLNRQLADLNNAKDEFIAVASHQLRTPATVVKQYLGLLLQGYAGELSNEQTIFAQTAYDSNERQLGLINGLLHVARLDAGKVSMRKASHDLTQLVGDTVSHQSAAFKSAGQDLFFKGRRKPILISIDKELLRMALENILDNANKYSPTGSQVTVALDHADDKVMISVTDTGVGIARHDIEKLFQKFSRLTSPLEAGESGTGLGLYWAKKIAKLHGGTINVQSKVGVGSTFVIELPST